MIPDVTNEMFELAVQMVNESSRNIFLTGKAGTGKTTFLRYIRENCPKQMAVVAPTGVAAINAGGVTIHSFFQLPFAPFIPAGGTVSPNSEEALSSHSLLSRLRLNGDKLKVLRQLELLVIDEISMVRADTMDAIDAILRHVRRRPFERFGGVQLLLIGDMFQLPPVIKDQEWKMLSPYYYSPFFFDSVVMRQEPPLYIEFTKIYRQSEERFIRLLNQVRNNELDKEGFEILEACYQPSARRNDKEGYIVLTTHNETARTINGSELARLDAPVFSYKAEIEEDFPPTAFPADEVLQLKVGAQVMFIRNDSDRSKRYFNGKIGTVTALSGEKIMVKCKDDDEEIEVKKEIWENIRYSLNSKTRDMEETLLGSFAQYPLRLAWAITIHKSQGLTFEKAIIDAGDAFAPGQIYVALSRCTSLDGMILQSRVREGSVFTDPRIVAFSKQIASSDGLRQELETAKKDYLAKLILQTFDFEESLQRAREIKDYVEKNRGSFNPEATGWTNELLDKLKTIQDTALKFHAWLRSQFLDNVSINKNAVLTERAIRAGAHFTRELETVMDFLQQSTVATDSKIDAKEYNEQARELFVGLAIRKHLLGVFDGPIEPHRWHQRKKEFAVPSFTANAYGKPGGEKTARLHPALHEALRKLRDSICARKGVPIYMVASAATLDELVQYLPQTTVELREITGFGEARVRQYGQEFLDIIKEYAEANGLESRIEDRALLPVRKEGRTRAKERKDTKAESYRMYREGKTIAEIATERKLTIQTIENHLAHYVKQGLIDIDELVSLDKVAMIEPVLNDMQGKAIAPVKEKLGEAISYNEIRLVLAWKQYKDRVVNDSPSG